MFTKANSPNEKGQRREERGINAALIPLIAHESVQLVHLEFQDTPVQSFVGSFVKLLHTFSTALESGLWPDRTRTWTLLFLSHASDDFTESFWSSGSSHNGGFLFIYLFNHANRGGGFLCANVYEGSEERHQTCSGREAFLVTLVCLSCWQVAGFTKSHGHLKTGRQTSI